MIKMRFTKLRLLALALVYHYNNIMSLQLCKSASNYGGDQQLDKLTLKDGF